MANPRIYIAPKRGRLPRKYELIGEPMPVKHKLRWISLFLAVGAMFWFGVYLVLR